MTDSIEVRFRGNPVPRVSSTSLVFWNGGNATLDSAALVPSDPLRIEVPNDCEILQVQIASSTRDVIGASVAMNQEEPSQAWLRFDFLDPNDGVHVRVLHTAGPANVQLRGTLKGLPNGISNITSGPGFDSVAVRLFGVSLRARALAGMMTTIGAASVAAAAFGPEDLLRRLLLDDASPSPLPARAILGFAGVIYALPGIIVLWRKRRRIPAAINPERHGAP
ncbi:MAG TPA: hypothetical protein VGR26_08325 [Acidimicrobiales bacterium]|nr:hypothetical protein [Acidimicrobiales bacterium]